MVRKTFLEKTPFQTMRESAQWRVSCALFEVGEKITCRKIGVKTGMNYGYVHQVLSLLDEKGFLVSMIVGRERLYRVKSDAEPILRGILRIEREFLQREERRMKQ